MQYSRMTRNDLSSRCDPPTGTSVQKYAFKCRRPLSCGCVCRLATLAASTSN